MNARAWVVCSLGAAQRAVFWARHTFNISPFTAGVHELHEDLLLQASVELRTSVSKLSNSLSFYILWWCEERGRQGSHSVAEGLLFLCSLLHFFFLKVSVRLKPALEQSFVIKFCHSSDNSMYLCLLLIPCTSLLNAALNGWILHESIEEGKK